MRAKKEPMILGLIRKIKEELEPKTRVTVKKSRVRKKPKTKKKITARGKPLRTNKPKKKQSKIKAKPSKKLKAKVKKIVKIDSGQLIGKVSHFFPNISVAVLTITRGDLSIGDRIEILGPDTLLKQQITSMQINHEPIQTARKGDDIGLKIRGSVRIKDKVFKVS